ncbi:hypothetical protein FXN65_10890 [Metapseudomonas lalkuanensis]|uniref:Uncharacterized protein n=1 Tax=Metapseudomonas lalkuanensis TaxID=2604832 RepID=A0A5J6QP09_9GAMM|nr:hypothetical protein [Pseudomonas lalkuanensis]QEY62556.1 hypothetical protein FXN65_10890 [Pseudomonas lalkuanensis]
MTDTTQSADAYVLVVEADADPVLVEGGDDYAITQEQTEVVVIAAAEQGPPGPQGIPGPAGGSSLQRLAGEVVSALRVLYEVDGEVFALDYRDAEHIDLLLGVSLTAADAGQPLNIQRTGVIEDVGWSWQPGRIWLGIDGQLTQTPPVDGFDVLLGAAVSATRITLNLQDPIDLE